jgi:RNA polymerase sigma-70 factor (ECF subfamily)
MHRNTDHFWTLLEPEHDRLRGFCRRITGDRDRGDDLCQEALLRALRQFHTLREEASFRSWLYRIVLNRYQNTRRGGAWKWLVFADPAETEGASLDPSPHLEAKRALEGALRILSREERVLVTLFELEGWRLSDLSELLGRSESALKVRLCRIRFRLRDELNATLARRERRALRAARKERIWIAVKPNVD